MSPRPLIRIALRIRLTATLLGTGALIGLLLVACSPMGPTSLFVARDLAAELDEATVRLPLAPLEETFELEGDSWLFRPNGNIQLSRSSNFWNRLTFFPDRLGGGSGQVSWRYRTEGPGGGDHRLALVFHERETSTERRRFEIMVRSVGSAQVRYSEIEPDGSLLVETILEEASLSPTNGDWRAYQVSVDWDRVRLTVDGREVLDYRLPADLMERVSLQGAWALELSRLGTSVYPSDALLRRLQVERRSAEAGPPLTTLSFRRDPSSDESLLRYLNFKYETAREYIPSSQRTMLKQIGLTLAENRTELLPALFAPAESRYRFALDVEPGDRLRLRYGLHQPASPPVSARGTFTARLRVGDEWRSLLSETLIAAEKTELHELDVPLPVRRSGRAEIELSVTAPLDDSNAVADPFAILGLWGAPQILRERGFGESRRPNVIIISADTLRRDGLSVYNPTVKSGTPSLERFSREATVFTKAYTSSPWTMPSHFSLFSGLYPSHHGLNRAFGFNSAAYEEVTTLAEVLAEAGYVTAAIASDHSLDPAHGFDKGFRSFLDSRVRRAPPLLPDLRRFLESHGGEEFFVFFHSYDPHAPLTRKTELEEDDPVRLGREVNYNDFVELDQVTDAEQSLVERLYREAVTDYDASFGKILDLLEEFGVLDDSIVVFTSDHGEELFEHGAYQHGHSLYEELLEVPLMIRFPAGERLPPRYDELTGLVDLFPTLLEYLGLDSPEGLDGKSFLGALRGDGSTPRRYLLAEALAWGPERKGVVTDRYKYVVTYADSDLPALGPRSHFYDHLFDTSPGRELYDLEQDPLERKNIAAEETDLAARLDALLTPLLEAQSRGGGALELDPERVKALRALGYIQ